mmetsp:Transcript_5977/g.16755  ORF Transcript_5977/g.16755 Transcript_5977/m.16755 type:complete len:798 (-) Transcript_5977:148-2541(-)
MSSSSEATTTPTTTTTTTVVPPPPLAHRDDDRVVYAGVAPEGWDNVEQQLPRQSATSTEALLDPVVAISDPYGWLRDETRTNPRVLDHLTAENDYTTALTQHLAPLRETLYREMVASIQETDYTTPRPDGDYLYYTRTIQGQSYTIYCRAPKAAATTTTTEPSWDGQADTPILPGEQVIVNVNELAEGQKYCSMGAVKHSPSHRLLAYSADYTGGETCLFYVKDLTTGEVVHHDASLEISGSLTWGADDSTLFYLKLDAAHRPYQVYKRNIQTSGTDNNGADDELLLEELDDLYWMGISKTLDGRYLLVETSSKETSEFYYLDLHDPTATALQCIAPRRAKVLYDVDHRNGAWWISSNVGNLPNMALFTAPAVANCADQWKLVTGSSSGSGDGEVLFPGSYERSLDHVTCFANHVVASGREGGLPRVWVLSLNDEDDGDTTAVQSFDRLSFAEEAYDVGLGRHYEFDTTKLVVGYDSMVTPAQSLEIDMTDVTQRKVLKEKKVPGYDKALYGTERTTVTARDGTTQIPVTLVYRNDVMEEHKASGKPIPTHLYGYGSYGACMEADFRATRLALLNRGIVYVMAHIRGGGEMGRQWYEEPNGAKYLCKKNTFNDFVDVAKWLVDDRKMTSPEVFSCEGRSAGGLLIGATINQAPELFKVAILGVPFVDVVPTMIDASIPLTTLEWEEWGNPNEVKYHQYMMEYSPTQNIVKGGKYPACLLTGGLHDPRVQYWEPSKFAAALRHEQNSETSGPVCVKMDMSAGHFSASDRYKYLKELSFDFAFMLDQLGLANVEVPADN